MDAVELMDARLNIRPDRERSAADRIKAAYGEKYDPLMMYDSKRDVADLLNEEAEARSVREFLRQKQKAQQAQQQRKPKRHEQEREFFGGSAFCTMHSRFFALCKKSVEKFITWCYNYFEFLYSRG